MVNWESGCIRAKVVVFGKSVCIWAKVVFVQGGCIRAKLVVILQSGYLGKVVVIWKKWLLSGKSG